MKTNDDNQYSLIIPFDDTSPSFVHEFEAGRLYNELAKPDTSYVNRYIHTENMKLVKAMAKLLDYDVKFEPSDYEEWVEVTLSKKDDSSDKPSNVVPLFSE